MNSRLQQFLSAENLSQAQFADLIGVARASVSHIIAGRNKPGFDFIEGMLTNFPNLNIEWLITGRGKMYKNASVLFPATEEAELAQISSQPVPATVQEQVPAMPPAGAGTTAAEQPIIETIPVIESIKSSEGKRSISKIIVLYSDNSYQELK